MPNFASLRRVLAVCLVAAIVTPVTFLLFEARDDLATRRQGATDAAMRIARVAQEHALKLFDLDDALQSRVLDFVGNRSDDAVRKDKRLHDHLQQVLARYPQVSHVSIFDATGSLLATSRSFPAPQLSIADRQDFVYISQHAGESFHVSKVKLGRIAHEPNFTTSTGRRGPGGEFEGVVAVGLRPSCFAKFYQNLMSDGTPMTITMLRNDGVILARWSPYTNLSPLADARSALTPLLPRWPEAGVTESPSPLDGIEKIRAYRRVTGYPVIVMASYPVSAIYAAWRAHVFSHTVLILLPCLTLALVLALCLRHLRQEELTWLALNAEAENRRVFEAAQKENLRLQALGNLVGNVAHDFNNLLMTLSANVEIGKRLRLTRFHTQLDAMERAVHRGVSLTRRLLGVTRKQPLRKEVVALQAWGKDFGLVRASLPSRIELRLEIPDDAWPVEVDPGEFELAILNIAVNARDAIAHEGWFSVIAQNVHLTGTKSSAVREDRLLITLADSGCGMTPEIRRHAFEPLFTTKRMGEGTGLGLAHVQAFCDQAGGTVTLDSAPGQGTTIRLYLPRSFEAPAAHVPDVARAADEVKEAPLFILLVEDNDEVAAAEEAVLTLLGHRVHRETEASVALLQLQKCNQFDCVVTDVQMPGELNGIDLARTIRRDFPDLPVVLVTGYAEELEWAEQTGFAVLPKPYSIENLKQTLARAVAVRNGVPVALNDLISSVV
jgi:signal transduction histidine kinase/CheY-like chemotaxis protein